MLKDEEMSTRKSVSKKDRFEVFKRDSFTCQYCGLQPQDVTLELDHIQPVSKGGDNDPMNLITACFDCNRGKGDRPLELVGPRPDADLQWLEMQQEIAELRRYQEAKRERDLIVYEITETLGKMFMKLSKAYFNDPQDVFTTIHKMVDSYSPSWVEDALKSTGHKIRGGYLDKWDWKPYTYGSLKNMSEERV